MWEPLLPPQPPWSLGGHWRVGKCSKVLRLRHWRRLGIVFAADEPRGGEAFFGRVLWDSHGWYLIGVFGSSQPVQAHLCTSRGGATLKWATGAEWVQELEEWEPQIASRVPCALVTLAFVLLVLLPCAFVQMYRDILANALICCCSIVHFALVYALPGWCTCAVPGARGPCLWLACALAVGASMALNAKFAAWLALSWWSWGYSQAYVACIAVTALCGLLSGSRARALESWSNAQNPEEWPGVAKVPHSHAECARVVREFEEACARWHHLYPFSLQVTDVFSVSNLILSARFAESHSHLASREALNVKQLYHGASACAAKAIIAGGFRSPVRMLRGSIPFWETPLKSWQYTAKTGSTFLLVCDVALGIEKSLSEEAAVCSCEVLCRTLGRTRDYDSLLGLTREDGGVLRVPEAAVFRPAQALPMFLLKVREKHVVGT